MEGPHEFGGMSDLRDRAKILVMSIRLLPNVFNCLSNPGEDRSSFHVPFLPDLPAGYYVETAHYCPMRQVFVMKVTHPSWPVVGPGQSMEEVEFNYRTATWKDGNVVIL